MGGKKSTTTTQTREIPGYLEAGSRQAVALGQNIASAPYQGFGPGRIAPLSSNESQAVDLASMGVGGYRPYLNQADLYSKQSAQSFLDLGAEGVQSYMNPYIKTALDPVARELQESAQRSQRDLAGQKAQIGAFGGSRYALQESEINRALNEATSDLYGRGFASAYDQALGAFSADRAAAAGAAGQQAQLAGLSSSLGTQDINNLLGTGALVRGVDQAEREHAYQEFVEARDWDKINLTSLLASLSVPHGETQTQETKSPSNTLAQLIGLGVAIAGTVTSGGAGAPAAIGAGSSIAGASSTAPAFIPLSGGGTAPATAGQYWSAPPQITPWGAGPTTYVPQTNPQWGG